MTEWQTVEPCDCDLIPEVVVEMVRRLAYALGIRGYNDLRLRLAEMAAQSARTIGSPLELARVLITNKAWIHFFWADYDNCMAALDDGAPLAHEAGDDILKAIALRLTAQVAKERKEMAKAKQLLSESLKIFKKADDEYQLCITYGTWGSLNRDLSNYKVPESNLREALRIASGLKNAEELKSVMCQKLTKLMIELDRLSEADEFNMQAEAILSQLRRQVNVAYCKLNQARIAERRKDLKKALDYAIEAEVLFVQYGDRREIAADLQRIREKAMEATPGGSASPQ